MDATPASLQVAFASFMLDNEACLLATRTLQTYRQQVAPFLAHCASQGAVEIHQITPTLIRTYLAGLRRRGWRESSVHDAARAIRRFLNFCVEDGFLLESPMRRVRMPRLPKEIKPAFDQEAVMSLLRACKTEREIALVLFLLDTGCRAAETVRLVGGDVDLTARQVTIRQGKGGKDRLVYLQPLTRRCLQRYYQQRGTPGAQEPIWLSERGRRPLTQSGLYQLLRRLGKRADVAHCSPHTFRRTFALWSLRAGMNIHALQKLMGHSDIQVLRPYLHLVEHDLQTAHQRYGSLATLASAVAWAEG